MKDINILVFGDEIVDYKYILSHILEHDSRIIIIMF